MFTERNDLMYGERNNPSEMLAKTVSFPSLCQLLNLRESPCIIAGPCAVESFEQVDKIAKVLLKHNVFVMRAGAYKPRTSPYMFQGIGIDGLVILDYVRRNYGIKVISEIMDPRDVENGLRYTDMIQIGTRNMQNIPLLREVGKTSHPIVLKRGFMSTLEELYFAAEYIANQGNLNIVLCERGIRSFDSNTRNLLDIASIAIIKLETTFSVIVDVSHSTGRRDIVAPISKAAIAAGADAIMVEVHNDPINALSDSQQQLDFIQFEELMTELSKEYL